MAHKTYINDGPQEDVFTGSQRPPTALLPAVVSKIMNSDTDRPVQVTRVHTISAMVLKHECDGPYKLLGCTCCCQNWETGQKTMAILLLIQDVITLAIALGAYIPGDLSVVKFMNQTPDFYGFVCSSF